MARFSIVIPTHEMENRLFFLRRSLEALWDQTFQDFEVVVADNSEDSEIKRMCEYYGHGVRYLRNPNKGMAQNTNFGIKKSRGDLIKILYLDDYLAHNEALQKIQTHFTGHWLVTGCEHSDGVTRFSPHIPRYSLNIREGNNTIGSPSVLTIRNDHPMMFDENMTWLLDCDYYARMYQMYSAPVILEDINVVIGIGKHQATNILSDELKMEEHTYLAQKYA